MFNTTRFWGEKQSDIFLFQISNPQIFIFFCSNHMCTQLYSLTCQPQPWRHCTAHLLGSHLYRKLSVQQSVATAEWTSDEGEERWDGTCALTHSQTDPPGKEPTNQSTAEIQNSSALFLNIRTRAENPTRRPPTVAFAEAAPGARFSHAFIWLLLLLS